MRKLVRLSLSADTMKLLEEKRGQVLNAADPKGRASTLWDNKPQQAFDEIREKLKRMTPAYESCMYCETNEASDIEHFWPKSKFPKFAFDWINYLYACSVCNSNYKRTCFPLGPDGEPLLIDPTHDDPDSYLGFSCTTGRYAALASELEPGFEKAKKSIEIFGLNRSALYFRRRDSWVVISSLICTYSRAKEYDDVEKARKYKSLICKEDRTLFCHLLKTAMNPNASNFLDQETLVALENCPEIRDWTIVSRCESKISKGFAGCSVSTAEEKYGELTLTLERDQTEIGNLVICNLKCNLTVHDLSRMLPSLIIEKVACNSNGTRMFFGPDPKIAITVDHAQEDLAEYPTMYLLRDSVIEAIW